MGRPKKDKDPFADLDSEFRDSVATGDVAKIRDLIAQTALNQQALEQAQEDDEDLAEKKETVKYAMEPYNDGKRANKLKIKYCRQVLGDKGERVP